MLDKKIEKALNSQLNAEMYSGYLYLAMAAWFNGMNLAGFVNWFKIQALEEQYHAMKFYAFIEGRGGRVTLDAIEKPPKGWKNPVDAFENVLSHERKVTGLINDLVALARDNKDFATENFLQWFVAEQVEEESNADELLQKVKLVEGNGHGMLMMNTELGQRMFKMPLDIGIGIMQAP